MISDGLVSTSGKTPRLPVHSGPSHAETSFSPPCISTNSPPYQSKPPSSGRSERTYDVSQIQSSPSHCRLAMPIDGHSSPACENVPCTVEGRVAPSEPGTELAMSEQASSESKNSPGECRESSRRIWDLEHALARSEDACTAAIRETFAAREQVIDLQKRMDELEGKRPIEESGKMKIRQDNHNKIVELESATSRWQSGTRRCE